MPTVQRRIETKHGVIALTETTSPGPQVLLIHGNSLCKEFFSKQMESPLGEQYTLVALDLPGHGESTNAHSPETSYTYSGYAEAIQEVMAALGRGPSALYGGSLGGNIGMELLGNGVPLRGLAINSAPPISTVAQVEEAYPPSDLFGLVGKETWSEADASIFLKNMLPLSSPESWMQAALLRADGQARPIMLAAALALQGHDQRQLVETSTTPLAVFHGSEDHFINPDYLREVQYKNLWRKEVHSIPDAGHAPFWENPAVFNALLGAFLEDVFAQ